MDFQQLIDSMNENTAKERSHYHLTYGKLIDVLKAAPADMEFDKRIKGVGSWRGSYIEIALYTEYPGISWQDEEFTGNFSDWDKWNKEHSHSAEMPRNANKLGALLESLIGKDFVGYKGGNFKIQEYKPLWLEESDSTCESVAIIGIDEKLNLITKQV